MTVKKKILVAPLNWGLGHATRCIPVIKKLLNRNVEVQIGGNGLSFTLLKKEFPFLKTHHLPGMEISYSGSGFSSLHLFLQLPSFLFYLNQEKQFIKKLQDKERFNAIISDNRYGLHLRDIPCVLITHQTRLKTPGNLSALESFINNKLRNYIHNFSQCWIPDFEGQNNLSGDLSHKTELNITTYFVEPLSRFTVEDNLKNTNDEFEILAIISGPEPQRTLFEEKIIAEANKKNLQVMVLQGKPGRKTKSFTNKNILIKNHADTAYIKTAILKAKGVIARAGYSTIMDMVALKKNALLIPTPGQTEQEYLATHLADKGWFRFETQNNFNINDSLFVNQEQFPGLTGSRLDYAIDQLLKM